MKSRKHFILVIVVLVLIAGFLAQPTMSDAQDQSDIWIKESFSTGKITDRNAFLIGAWFAQLEINQMRKEAICASRERKDILVGLRGVLVGVEGMKPEVQNYGLTQQLLQTDTELRLRQNGIRIFTVDEAKKFSVRRKEEQYNEDKEVLSLKRRPLIESLDQKYSDEHFLQCLREFIQNSQQRLPSFPPCLYVNVNVVLFEEGRRAAFSIEVELDEGASLYRNTAFCQAPIWDTGGVADCPTSRLKENVRELLRCYLDEFIYDYLAANSTRSDSERDPEQCTQKGAKTCDPNTPAERTFTLSEDQKAHIEKNVPAASREWRVFETTAIEGWVKKVERGTIFKTVSGNIYEVVDVVILLELELRPDVTVLTDGQFYKLFIKGVSEPLLCRKLNRGDGGIASGETVIEAQITNNFDGFEYGNIYKLSNGQVWEQADLYIYIWVAVMPRVTIWQDGSVYRMKVDGIDRAVGVRQLR